MLVLQTKSSALKLDLSVSCKKRNLDLKLLCVCVCFIFSSSHLSLKETPTKHFANAKSPTQRSWFYELPFGRCSDGPLCLKTCTSTRWRRCGGVCIVVFGTTTFFVSDSFLFCFFYHHQHQGSCKEDILFHWQQEYNICFCKVYKFTPPLHPAKPGLFGVLRKPTETHRWLLCFYTPLQWEEWKDSPNRQNPIALYHVSGVDE